MKPLFPLVPLALTALVWSGCGPDGAVIDLEPTDGANAVWKVGVSGLHCEGCANGLRSELLRADGVMAAEVHFGSGMAHLAVDTNLVTADGLARLVTEAGYVMGGVRR